MPVHGCSISGVAADALCAGCSIGTRQSISLESIVISRRSIGAAPRFRAASFMPLSLPPHFDSAITHSTPCIAFRCSLIWMKPRRIGGWESLRVLRPGGRLVLTIHGAVAAKALDTSRSVALHERGFFHARSRKLEGIMPDWYQTSWHTPEYMASRMARHFVDINVCLVADGTQDVIAATAL